MSTNMNLINEALRELDTLAVETKALILSLPIGKRGVCILYWKHIVETMQNLEAVLLTMDESDDVLSDHVLDIIKNTKDSCAKNREQIAMFGTVGKSKGGVS
jgi:ABC-type uncharacterized transport system ATPase subunit